MTVRRLTVLVMASLLLPSDVLAGGQGQVPPQQPGWGPWVIPNPFQPLPLPALPEAPPMALPSAVPAGAPVVLELFTSEDCAACESAEFEIRRLMTQPVAGARLIPLAFHVEFYGGSASTDPYVLPAATRRQQTYDAARGRVYTPQAIVDGDTEFGGADDARARAAITAATRQPKGSGEVSRGVRLVGPAALALSVRYAGSGRRGATLSVALAEGGLELLHHGGLTAYDRTPLTPVVRALQELGAASPSGGSLETTVAIPPGAVRSNVTAVVLLQDASSHRILGVGTLPAGVL